MAFATIPAWSTTAGTNTEIDGISLAENVMAPSAVNNAFREMMSQVAEFTRRGSDLASADPLNLDSIDTMFLDITGSTTVSAVTLTDGHSRRARATGAFQLTASATLVVNGSTSTNYTTTAGDLLFFEGYSGGTVRVWTVAGGAATTFATNAQAATGTSTVLAVNPAGLAFATSGYATTATAAGTTTLTAASEPQQFFTGTTTQTVVLPVTSTLNLGRPFRIVNNSTGAVTVQSSGANTIIIVAAGSSAVFTCILTSGTTAASWDYRLASPGPHVILEDQKSSGTAGGDFNSGADRTRTLNTEVYDPYGLCTLSSSQFTLPAGTYCIEWTAPAARVDAHQSLLYNVTDTAEVKRGSSERAGTGADTTSTISVGSTVVTITAAKAFEIRHRATSTFATSGFGVAGSFGTEVYTRVEITRMA